MIIIKLQEADFEEPDEKCQCEECRLEERDAAACDACLAPQGSPDKQRSKSGTESPVHSQDCGYSSGNGGGCCETMSGSSSLMSSPEGSVVACSEGFCNHDRGDCSDMVKSDKTLCTDFTLSLQEMLMVGIDCG